MTMRMGLRLAGLVIVATGLLVSHAKETTPPKEVSDEDKEVLGPIAYDLGELSQKISGPDQDTFENFKLACDYDHAKGCEKAGYILFYSDKIDRDPPRGLRFYEKGCRLGGVDACVSAGFVHEMGDGVPANEDMAQTFYQMACASGSDFACKRVKK